MLAPVGSAPDGTFLKRGSGKAMSERASALAQMRGDAAGARATLRWAPPNADAALFHPAATPSLGPAVVGVCLTPTAPMGLRVPRCRRARLVANNNETALADRREVR